ncbi:hypothetical protein D3C79_966080 [compost metagenome]
MLRGLQQIVVQPQHHVGGTVFSFHAQTVKQRNAVFQRDKFQLTVTLGFKGFFDRRARAPVGSERIIGVDRQYRFGEHRCGAQ